MQIIRHNTVGRSPAQLLHLSSIGKAAVGARCAAGRAGYSADGLATDHLDMVSHIGYPHIQGSKHGV